MELKITSEKVKKAAEKSEDVKNILQTLFPEAFKDDVHEEFIKELADLINKGKNYEIYKQIPGYNSLNKAQWIMDQIKNHK